MNNQLSSILIPTLITLGIVFILFLICRELVCWYWKINKISSTLDEVLEELKKMNGKKL